MDFQRNGRCKNLVLLFFLSDADGFDFSPFLRDLYRELTILLPLAYDTSIDRQRYKSRKTGGRSGRREDRKRGCTGKEK